VDLAEGTLEVKTIKIKYTKAAEKSWETVRYVSSSRCEGSELIIVCHPTRGGEEIERHFPLINMLSWSVVRGD